MTDKQHLLATCIVSFTVLTLGCALLVWPARRDARETRAEIAKLEKKIESLDEAHAAVDRLSAELEESRRYAAEQLKAIPRSPDVAQLMRRLSMPVDGRHVLDQTFTAGSAHPAVAGTGEDFAEQAMPLTVDMQASFDSIFALLRLSESMDRLVRIASVRLISGRVSEQTAMRSDAPPRHDDLLTASVGLEVIYEPADVGEGR
jgi:Tfp pilus assembly protein PilO